MSSSPPFSTSAADIATSALDSAAPTVLVTGGTGAVGGALVRALAAAGETVRVLSRGPAPAALPDRVTVMQGDIMDTAILRRATMGVTRLFHLAARVPGGAESNAESFRINVDGAANVARAAAEAGVTRMVLFSTINVYGASEPGALLDEGSPVRPRSAYAASKAAAEEVVWESTSQDGMELVVLRLAAVYGPGMRGSYRRLLRALARGRFVWIGPGTARRTVVHEDDAARAALLAGTHRRAAGETFNVTDGAVHTWAEMIDAMCDALTCPRPRLRLPAAPVLLAAAAVERGCRTLGVHPPVTREAVSALVEDLAVSGARLQTVVGYRPRVELRAGWQATVSGSG